MRGGFSAWLGAGMIATGISAALFAGAGVAAADPESSSDSRGAAESSGQTKSAENTRDSAEQRSDKPRKVTADRGHARNRPALRPDRRPGDDATDESADAEVVRPDDTAVESGKSTPAESETSLPSTPSADTIARVTSRSDGHGVIDPATDAAPSKPSRTTAAATVKARTEPAAAPTASPPPESQPDSPSIQTEAGTVTDDAIETDVDLQPVAGAEPAPPRLKLPTLEDITDAVSEVEDTVLKMSAVTEMSTAAAPATPPDLLNLVGSVLFTVATLPLKLFEQTPVVPPGSTVTIGRSTLDVGCGCGQSVDARWYFPNKEEPPRSVVYLQHGFLRSNSTMSAMAIQLAERTNSVVVTPTLSTNPFAADGCTVNGEPMQRAVADLFDGDRTALTDSAEAAGWVGGELPTPFVLAGHSAGGGLAVATAGYTVNNGAVEDLLMVVMLDGVANGNVIPVALDKLSGDHERPVLQIAAPPYSWNANGRSSTELAAARPGEFVGVEVVGGSHIDPEGTSTDILAQIAAGFSQPKNVLAVQDIAVGWINDELNGTTEGVYGEPGDTVVIPTDAGDATVVLLGTAAPGLPAPQQPDTPDIASLVGSLIFDAFQGLRTLAEGPPVIPPELRDSVEVSTSTLVIAEGHEVPANWYFPITEEGEAAPERMIYLQHGFLASAPLYSYTAAYLAEGTNSVVVATTLTSNPFAPDGVWLGGDAMHRAVAQLFLDEDRRALNASLSTAALKAGRDDAVLPDRFVLVGHSLGGGFAPGVAGHYAEGLVAERRAGGAAPNQLAGVLLYDGVPPESVLPNAMDRLQELDPADYVPVYEIGAPPNAFNSSSTVNEELTDARPDKFNGVILDGGTHMDAMQGGNALIQFVAYVVAGFPQSQNPPAVRALSLGWINDMFAGRIDPATGTCANNDCAGIYPEPGSTTIEIPVDGGTATGVVISAAPESARVPGVAA